MIKDKKIYKKYAEKRSERSPILKNCLCAFSVGGFICCVGEALFSLYKHLGVDEKMSSSLVCVSLIFIAALLTGIGVFDDIAKVAGAGTLVPITGFSNAVCSPAIDTKSEGFVLGVGAKMFTIAGPVIVYGTVASVIYGVLYWAARFFIK